MIITGRAPLGGPAGTIATITGSGFGATQSTSTVTFNGIAATPSSWSDTAIVVPSPVGLLQGYASIVITVGGIASAGVSWLVPTIIIPTAYTLLAAAGSFTLSLVTTSASLPVTIKHRFQTIKADVPTDDVSANVWDDTHPITAQNGLIVLVDHMQIDGWRLGPPRSEFHELGGSRLVGTRTATWQTVPLRKHPVVKSGGWALMLVRVERKTLDVGTSAEVRLVDLDAGSAVVGHGVPYATDTNWNEETFLVALNAASHHVELQIQGSNANADVFAMGRVELYAIH